MLRLLAAASILLGSLVFSPFASAPSRAEGTPPDAVNPNAAQPTLAAKPGDKKETVLNIVVAGDSIADGIWGGLYRMLQRDKRFNIVREARNSSGFTAFDWQAEMGEILKRQPADAIVFLVGANERQTLLMRDKPRTLFRTAQWEENYIARVEAFMQYVKAKNIPLLWVGLPIARKPEFNKDSQYLNDIYAAAAKKNNVLYLDIWPMFTNKDGEYSAYLPDAAGKNHLLRHNDGVHFTPMGYEMIAEAVLASLRKNVAVFGPDGAPQAPPAAPPAPPPTTLGDAPKSDTPKSDTTKSDAPKSQAKITPPDAVANPPPAPAVPVAAPPAPQQADGSDAKRVEELKKSDDSAPQNAPEMNALREPRPKATRRRTN